MFLLKKYNNLLRQAKMLDINFTVTKTICLFAILMIGLFYVNCDENITNSPSKDHPFEISYPLNHTSVYASQLYIEDNDSLYLANLLIYSVQFRENQVADDTIYYKGLFNEYLKWYDNNRVSTDSSEITVAFWKNWILLQQTTYRFDEERILSKPTHSFSDTTIFFIWDAYYFSLYPRYLQANSQASLFIPGYLGSRTFTFSTGQFEEWSDIYGEESGLRYTVWDTVMNYEKPVNNYSIASTGLIDKHGLILSQKSRLGFSVSYIFPDFHMVRDTVIFNYLTRRIVDFIDPAQIADLSVYADEVQEKGLEFFINNFE